ncbi:MAG TPA: amino acid adenylation domain-containing protein, partial [Thermoanaerobaculia bacterium]|nr:amino acid adenylation domain-containing protein [Thermoanaerobaculia bacterium]
PAVAPALPQVDLRGLPAPAAEAARIARQGARVPFDLARGPLLRVALVVLGEREHLLLVTLHHIVSDGWSMGVLVGELATLYAAFAAGRPSPLSELPIQYADFASWQREWLTGEVLAGQLEYWRGRLAGAPALLELPTDRPRPALLGTRGGRAAFQLSAGLTAALRDLCQRQGATLFMALLAAFQALLARYSRSADVVVGTPIANRTRAETEGLIGFFVNTLALRADLSGDPGFGALLARTKELTLAAYAHQDLPFEKLVEELKPERALSYSPLVQVMLILQNAPLPAPPAGELELSLFEVAGEGAKFDLTLALIESGETGGGMRGQVEYNRDLFDAATPLRLLGHFEALLRQAAADPARPLAEIDLLGAAERRQTLGEWNDTASDFPRDKTIHQLFAAQARATPAATALVCGDLSLTYRQLDARANRLARHLASLGVGPEVRVGLCLNRSLEAVVAILGILKAGGAYVPLDPAYPRDRLAFMLEDAAAPVVVTVASQVATLPDLAARGVRVVVLDREAEAIGREIARAPASGAAAANLAYVMYTSGSTGTPKGVAVTHRAVVRLVKDNHFAAFSAAERVLQLAPIAFDASTMEIWGALLNGSPLVVFPAYAPSLAELGAAIEAQGITTLWLTAGLFHQMVDGQLASLRGVRQLLAGGDVLSVPHVERALAGLPGTVLIDGYGPTENTTFTCCQPMRGPQRFAASVPIGRPIANTRAFLVDAAFLPIPIGVPGELLAGGDGLARGYLDRPDLTAEKFIPDAWSGEPGGRLYRTGDLARHLPDGRLEFLGRIDGQVKLRGFRIELGEIEAHLGQHPAVRGAVVAAREDMPGDRRLVAYVVARDAGARADLAPELRTYLRSRLPEHMVPSAFVALDALPLSPNGKVDRRALPAPELGRHASSRSFVAPRSPVEELLAGIWSAVLGLDAVSVRDNFFSLGGHSLLATQVVSRTREVCGVELPLRTLFEAPTIAELAPHVEAGRQRGLAAPPLVARPRREPLPASFAQERLWFLDQLGTEGSSYNVPLALQLDGGLDVSALAAALGELVRRHEALRTTFASVSSAVAQVGQAAQVVQVVAPDAALTLPALPGIDLRDLPAAGRTDAARRAAAQAAWAPFDLARGPLLRAALLRLAGEEHVLLLTLHHIVADGWSMGVLLRELAALYDAAREGRPSPLPALAVQYADFAVWQREWLQGPVLAELLAYWRGRLADAPAVLDLPLDRPRPALQTFRGGNLRFTLPPALRRSLADLGRRHGVSLFMTLLAAFQSLLARYTSAEDVVVGSPIANRNRAETEALIGFFVNTLVLRGDLSGDPTFAELLRRVRETTLDAYAHQDLPFEKLVEELRPERDLSRNPLFQVMFVLQNMPASGVKLAGLEVEAFALPAESLKFDL